MQLSRHLTTSPLPQSTSNLTNLICIDVPFNVNSKGLWVQHNDPQWWLNASLPLVEFELILFCISLAIAHNFLKRFGVSKISSQILIGMIFGSSWNELDKAKFKFLEVESKDVLVLLADLGYTLYLFLSAVKIDVTRTIRTRKTAFLIGIPSLVVPLISASFVQTLYDETLTKKQVRDLPILFVFHGMTSLPVVASLVSELQIVNSELGRLGLSSALVCDMFGLFIMATTRQAKRYKENPSRTSAEIAASILLFVVIMFVFRPAMLWIIKQTPQGMPVSSSYIQAVILMALASTVLSNFTGQASIMGPYLLGLAVPDGAPLGSTLVDKIECIVSDIFMPILIVSCAMRADVSKLLSASFDDVFTKLNIILICVVFAAKVVSCVLSSRYCKLPFKDSLALSLIMNSKGSVQLVLYTIAKDYNTIDNGLFVCCIISILFTATFVPVAVRGLYDPSMKYAGYQNRNIMHLNPASDELRLLACIHRNENINAIIHLLNISCPTVENPLAVHIFHLIELSGKTGSIFISHKLQNNPLYNDDDRFYSRQIIHSFNQFERDNDGTVSVECFTAVSPCRVMHDDVCTLALDKIASLIILPFHQTWTVDGYIDDEDNMIRTLNYSVLERAPCSVGIFVDRGNLWSIVDTMGIIRRAYSVCVIFLGGKDDREAISYAKRMARDSRVKLTVLRLAAASTSEENIGGSKKSKNWEDLVDSEVLRDFKVKCLEDDKVMFIEEVCRDGQETAMMLREIVHRFDLMIVGRRNGLECPQTAGLDAWNEFPELGALGDLIASTDINTRASLLVIQQQKII